MSSLETHVRGNGYWLLSGTGRWYAIRVQLTFLNIGDSSNRSLRQRHRFEFGDLAGLLDASVLPLLGVCREQVVPIEQRSCLRNELVNDSACLEPSR